MDLVTGGAGLLGHNLALKLHARGARVRVFDYQKPPGLPGGVEVHQGDIRDAEHVREALRDVRTVYHLAAVMHVGKIRPAVVESVNIGGLRKLLECAQSAGVKRVVFTSTIEIYGVKPAYPCYEDSPKDPPPGYAAHKWQGEKICLEFSERSGIEVAFTRMPMIFGPGFYHFKPILYVFDSVRKGRPLFVMDGGERRGVVVGLHDAAQGLILTGTSPEAAGEAFNICAPDVFTHRSLLEGLIRRAGSSSRVLSVPSRIVRPAFELVRALKLSPVAPEHFYFTLHDCVYDISKAAESLGYAPRTDSVSAMFEAYESYLSGRRRDKSRKVASDVITK